MGWSEGSLAGGAIGYACVGGVPRYGSRHPMRSWSVYGPWPRGGSTESSRGRPHPLADDCGQLLCAAVELAQRDLPGGDETEEQDERTVLRSAGKAPCVFTRRRNSSLRRSITLVVRSVFHCALGKLRNVSSSAPPSCRRLLPRTGGEVITMDRSP